MNDFDIWFARLTGMANKPHEWQRSLATETVPRSRLIHVPTGMGKTFGVLATWAWHRIHRQDDAWPRRLIWCLPMRVLVEQTYATARDAFQRLESLWDGAGAHEGKFGVHLLMGGEDAGGDWHLFPEECSILVGTQDMVLSRALNRGYASGRARWPVDFGVVSHDVLWVMDEVQLMDVGLATSGQLQAYHDIDACKGFRPRHTWWMSATLQPDWLKTVDTEPKHSGWVRDPITVPHDQRGIGLGAIPKTLSLATISTNGAKTFGRALASRVLDEHRKLDDGEYGRISLVVCNTVERACATFDALRAQAPHQSAELVHSRFRPAERSAWTTSFLSRASCVTGADRIIVATQVVEAGVDISAGVVVTELAPWPSLVQRFGRCARYGGRGTCLVVDRGREENDILPYTAEELEASWTALSRLNEEGGDVGIAHLEAFEEGLGPEARKALFPYEPKHLLLRREFDELFDTTSDLTGADLDISRFIRASQDRDLLVLWLDIPKRIKGQPQPAPRKRRRPFKDELCPVPFLQARDWLCGVETKTSRKPRLRGKIRAWLWDWIDGDWVVADRAGLIPGRIVCVASDCGGYRPARGFDPESETPVAALYPSLLPTDSEGSLADDCDGADDVSVAPWKTIACHCGEVAAEVNKIAEATKVPQALRDILALAGRWHDLGKSHPAFQGAIRLPGHRPDRCDLAKAPREAWLKPPGNYRTLDGSELRPGLRHELASALALFAVLKRYQPRHPALLGPWAEALQLMGASLPDAPMDLPQTACEREVLACSADDFDLLAYLVASHHGKVRLALHASPKDQDYRDRDGHGLPIRGVREGDVLPSVPIDLSEPPLPQLTLTLEPASLGLSPQTGRSWRERTLDLLDRFGPGALAWLETLLRAADCRASRLTTDDPVFATQELRR